MFQKKLTKKYLKKFKVNKKINVKVDCFKCLKKHTLNVLMVNRLVRGSITKNFELQEGERLNQIEPMDGFSKDTLGKCGNAYV